MSGFLVVPDALYDAIHKRLDEEIAKHPEAEKDREHLYRQLLNVHNLYGQVPDFTLVKADQ